jgi:hypothetical protein
LKAEGERQKAEGGRRKEESTRRSSEGRKNEGGEAAMRPSDKLKAGKVKAG